MITTAKQKVIELLKRDPAFHGAPDTQADIILAGAGDCSQCSGWGCRDCNFTGEDMFFGRPPKREESDNA